MSTHTNRMVVLGGKYEAQSGSWEGLWGNPLGMLWPKSNFHVAWSEGKREVPEPLKPCSTFQFSNLPAPALSQPKQASHQMRSNKYQARLSVQSLKAEAAGR